MEKNQTVKKRKRCNQLRRTIQEGQQFIMASKRVTKPTKMTKIKLPSTKSKIKRKKHKKITQQDNQQSFKPKPHKKISKIKDKDNRSINKSKIQKIDKQPKNKKPNHYSSSLKIQAQPQPHINPILPQIIQRPLYSQNQIQFSQINRQQLDICLCIDSSGSMLQQISLIPQIIKTIKLEANASTKQVKDRYSLITYRDHSPRQNQRVTNIFNFSLNNQRIEDIAQALIAWGGGQNNEAVHDALYDAATRIRWQKCSKKKPLRYIIHILDAPPYGSQYGNQQQQQGCVCGLKTYQIAEQINNKQINYRMMVLRENPKMKTMEQVLTKQIKNLKAYYLPDGSRLIDQIVKMLKMQVLS